MHLDCYRSTPQTNHGVGGLCLCRQLPPVWAPKLFNILAELLSWVAQANVVTTIWMTS